MYILVPLAILIGSVVGIFLIVFKKLSHVKELSLSATLEVENRPSTNFAKDMFPEIFEYFQRVNVPAHKSSLLLEFEKFLRRTRIMLLRADNLSNKLIHKVRDTHINETQKAEEKAQKVEEAKVEAEAIVYVNSITTAESPIASEFKKKEQEIILSIAQNPKNKFLYKNLGDLYVEMQQWHDARESFSSALQLDPKIRGVKRKLELANKMLSSQGGNLKTS